MPRMFRGTTVMEDDLRRMYVSYVRKPIRNTDEFIQNSRISDMTLDSVIQNSEMGQQNAFVQSLLKEYVIVNEKQLLAIPAASEANEALIKTMRKSQALRVGQLKAQMKRGRRGIGKEYIRQKAVLRSLIRIYEYSYLFTKEQLEDFRNLKYILSRPRLLRSGEFRVNYRKRSLSQKQLVKLLS